MPAISFIIPVLHEQERIAEQLRRLMRRYVNHIDQIVILSYLYGGYWAQYLRCEDGADANDDGELTVDDYYYLRYHAGDLPTEASGDATPDELGCSGS